MNENDTYIEVEDEYFTSIRDVLEKSIRTVQLEQKYYLLISKEMTISILKDLCLQIIDEKHKYEKMLVRIFKDFFGDLDPELPNKEVTFPSLKILDDFLLNILEKDRTDLYTPTDIINIVINVEQSMAEYYKKCSKATEHPDIKFLFGILEELERNLKKKVEHKFKNQNL